jgi:hypothetical protein
MSIEVFFPSVPNACPAEKQKARCALGVSGLGFLSVLKLLSVILRRHARMEMVVMTMMVEATHLRFNLRRQK